MEEKKAIRKQIFAARKAHTYHEIDDWSMIISEIVSVLPDYKVCLRSLYYADYNQEGMT